MTDERRGKRSPKNLPRGQIGGEDYDIGFGETCLAHPSLAEKEIHPVPEEERPRVEDHEPSRRSASVKGAVQDRLLDHNFRFQLKTGVFGICGDRSKIYI